MKPPSTLEKKFMRLWDMLATDYPIPLREHRFHPKRMWRFDFAWPEYKLAVEIDGGTFIGGRHNQGIQFSKDCEKLNAATLLGWRVLRYTTIDLRQSGAEIVDQVITLLRQGKQIETEQRKLFT